MAKPFWLKPQAIKAALGTSHFHPTAMASASLVSKLVVALDSEELQAIIFHAVVKPALDTLMASFSAAVGNKVGDMLVACKEDLEHRIQQVQEAVGANIQDVTLKAAYENQREATAHSQVPAETSVGSSRTRRRNIRRRMLKNSTSTSRDIILQMRPKDCSFRPPLGFRDQARPGESSAVLAELPVLTRITKLETIVISSWQPAANVDVASPVDRGP